MGYSRLSREFFHFPFDRNAAFFTHKGVELFFVCVHFIDFFASDKLAFIATLDLGGSLTILASCFNNAVYLIISICGKLSLEIDLSNLCCQLLFV
ncbi:hypothetical protein OZ13_20330 [Xanthomonas cannabis pv. cannabis]|nr:hypothetical protein OZ13_20330 [Xanthomonas cannabis pv. cannabis]